MLRYAIECKYQSEAIETLSPLVLQKMSEDNFNELDDYGAPFCEDKKRRSCNISLFKFRSFDQFNPPPPPESPQILDI